MGTKSTKSKKNGKDTRQHIIDTARALFSESSYLGVSMNDIATELDITKAALYYHFASKENIYNAVLDEVLNDINAALLDAFKEQTLDRQLYKVIKNYLDLGLKEKNIVKATLLSGEPTVRDHVIQNRKQIDGIIQPLLKNILAEKGLSGEVDYRLLATLLICMMDGILLEYSLSGSKIDSDKIAKQWVTFWFKGSMASRKKTAGGKR
jgi:AcrR family transcriptional regulator